MKRMLICGSCLVSMLALAIALVMALGEEIWQRGKQRSWREAMAQ